MQSILEQLFNGDIYPSEQIKIKLAGYQEARKVAIQAHDAFEEKLSQQMKQELDEWFSKEADVSGYYSTQTFMDGFKLGARLMLEIMEVGKDD